MFWSLAVEVEIQCHLCQLRFFRWRLVYCVLLLFGRPLEVEICVGISHGTTFCVLIGLRYHCPHMLVNIFLLQERLNPLNKRRIPVSFQRPLHLLHQRNVNLAPYIGILHLFHETRCHQPAKEI